MMDDMERAQLFMDIVESKIRSSKSGLLEVPLPALREYHDRLGLAEDVPCFLEISLPGSENGLFNYVAGCDFDQTATLELIEMYYYDATEDAYEPISGGSLLYGAIYRDFYSGKALICGRVMIDHYGRLWIQASLSDEICVDLRITFN